MDVDRTGAPGWRQPGALQIARAVIDSIGEVGWQKTWADCRGFEVRPGLWLWLDGFVDRDYEAIYLLRVWSDTDLVEGQSLTVADHLAVYDRGDGEIEVTWRGERRLFFDADSHWVATGLQWWADWCRTAMAASRGRGTVAADLAERVDEHNARVRAEDRRLACLLRLEEQLPYLRPAAVGSVP